MVTVTKFDLDRVAASIVGLFPTESWPDSGLPHAVFGISGATGWPTLRMASMNKDGRPHSELQKIAVTLTAIATIAQTGWTSPVAASGMPMPLRQKASSTFCTILR
jgi:hypothetical protein